MIEINRKIQPAINLLDKFDFHQPLVSKLDNKIPVYQLITGTQDITKIEFVFKAGSWFEDKVLVSKFTNKLLKEGTKSFTATTIHETIDYYGAHLETSSDKDMAYVALYSLNKHIDKLLPILEEVIFHPVFPENELLTRIQNKKQEYLINIQKVKYTARWKFNELIFGKSHPYGRFFDAGDFDNLKSLDLMNFHKCHYSAGNCFIIAAGKISDNLLTLLNKHFGKYNDRMSLLNNRSFNIERIKDHKEHIIRDTAIQSAIRIGKVMINKGHPDYLKLKVLNTILGGYFGSRLMTNIREDKGYTYGIGSSIASLQNSGFFFISSEVGSDVTDDAIGEVYHEIGVLQEKKVPEKELNLVRNYMLGSFLRSLDGPFALSESYKNLIEYGLDSNYFRNYIETIKIITPEDIRVMAQTYFKKETLYELKVGK
jgi:predicted Zn-dependent peptidase